MHTIDPMTIADTLANIKGVSLGCKGSSHFTKRLSSGWKALDSYLNGGLLFGTISEWGLPLGKGGRDVIRMFIATASRDRHILWVYGQKHDLMPYPPSWAACGVCLDHVFFAHIPSHPVMALKPLLLNGVFRVIVFDSPQEWSRDDWAFLSHQARQHGQHICVLQDHLLTPERGNVWARLRLNCWRQKSMFHVSAVRGVLHPHVSWESRS